MEAKLIVRKEDVAKHGLEEKVFQLAKVINAEQSTWVITPDDNLKKLISTLEEKRISYGIESAPDMFRERLQ